MPRKAREKTDTDTYHIMIRGINKQAIFLDHSDYYKFIDLLRKYKSECGFNLYAYCLMNNHVHIVLKETDIPLEIIFKKINTSYASFFNYKYQRCGHLFQDRFRSEPIKTDAQLLQTVRYIHRNPIKAGLCTNLLGYRFSSYSDYVSDPNELTITDVDFILTVSGGLSEFKRFSEESMTYECMDIDNTVKVSDSDAFEIYNRLFPETGQSEPCKLRKDEKRQVIQLLRKNNLSIAQISRITGFDRGFIKRHL